MVTRPATGDSAALFPASNRTIALILASAIFMEQVDSTALATALPAMARSFGVPPLHLSLAITGYLLSIAVFLPISGAIADRLGSRTVFRLAIGVFTLGSILCGLSTDVWLLVLARIVQGFGGALMVPVGRLTLIRSVPKSEFVALMGWVLVPAMIGPIVGPLVGGFLVSYLSWRWIFWINVPLGLLGILLTTLFIPQIRAEKKQLFDIRGAVLSGLSLASLIFVLESLRGGGSMLMSQGLLLLLVLGLGAGFAYWRHARRHPAPVLDFRLLRIRTLYVACTGGLLFRIGFGSFPFLLPLMLQLGFGKSAFQSGLITFSAAVGSVVAKAIARPVLRRFGYRDMLIWNSVVCTAYFGICAFFRPDWPLMLIYAVLIVGGCFRSLQFTGYGTLCYADIPPERTGAAIAFHSTMQQVSVTLGVAISATILSASAALSGHPGPLLEDFTLTMLTMASLCLAGVYFASLLPKDAAAELSGHRRAVARVPGEVEKAELPAQSR